MNAAEPGHTAVTGEICALHAKYFAMKQNVEEFLF